FFSRQRNQRCREARIHKRRLMRKCGSCINIKHIYNRVKTKAVLLPPKPKELDKIALTGMDCHSVTGTRPVSSIGFLKLILGNTAEFFRHNIAKTASTATAAASM